MLAIPSVKPVTTSTIDTSGLHRFLSGQQSYNEANINSDILLFSNIRSAVVTNPELTDSSVVQLHYYCHQLKSFAPRFAGVELELNLAFSWNDGFAASKKITTSSIYFELACCLWNLGAFESLRGARIDRTSEEGIRAANKHFQQAAGYFEYIREQVMPHIKIATIPSLSEDSLTMVKNLMLAQAQLCFYEKAVKDKKKDLMKSAIIAKLAAQTSLFYSQASTACKTGALGPLLDISWYAITDFQSKCFHGAAEYWQAVASKEVALSRGTGYGEEIARYKRAENFVSQALALSKKYVISPSLPAGAEGLLQAVLANKKTAEYDLSTVYMESVPTDDTLVEVAPVAMVRPAALPDLSNGSTPADILFRYVLPKELLASSRKFQDEVQSIHQSCTVEAEEATNVGRVTLSSVGLPGSLEAVKSEVPLPDGLWVKIQRVQSMGNFERLPRMFDDLNASARRAVSTMTSIDESLDREERVDEEFRSRYPDWNGPKSSSLNTDIRSNNRRMREAYGNAQNSDNILSKELTDVTVMASLSVLSQSKDQLLGLFPKEEPNLLDFDETLDAKSSGFGPEAAQLELRLHDMADAIETRAKALEDLKKMANMDFIELVSGSLGDTAALQTIQQQHLESCRGWRDTIKQGVARQEMLLAEILQLNTAFVKSRETSPLALKNNEVIQRLEQSVAKYFALHSQITAGVTFYSNLQAKLTTLLQSSDDLAYTQQWQRSEFEASRTSAYQRTSQETLDHEYAMRLANEFSGTDSATSPVNSAPPKPSKPAASGVPNPSEIVYGTAVSGPPPSASMTYSPAAPGSAVHQAPAAAGGAIVYAQTAGMPAQHTTQYQPPAPPQQAVHQPQVASPVTYQQPAGAQYIQQQQAPAPQQYVAPPPPAHVYTQQVQYQQPSQSPQYPPQQPQQQQPHQQGLPVGYSPYVAVPAQPVAAPAAPSYQYNNAVYSALPPPAQQVHAHPGQAYQQQPQLGQQPQYQQPQYQQQQQQQQYQPPVVQAPLSPADEFNRKVNSLCEMGFDRQLAMNALNANNNDEEAALNSLLTGATSTAPAPSSAAGTSSTGGFFGKIWGKH